MEVYALPARAGKTALCIDKLRDNPKAWLLVPTDQDRATVSHRAPDVADRVMPVTVLRSIAFFPPGTVFYVDDAEHCLRHLLGVVVAGVTVNIRKQAAKDTEA